MQQNNEINEELRQNLPMDRFALRVLRLTPLGIDIQNIDKSGEITE